MVTGLQSLLQSLPLDGIPGKSQSMDSETIQPFTFGEILKFKEKQLQEEQQVSVVSIAAALMALQARTISLPSILPTLEIPDLRFSVNGSAQPGADPSVASVTSVTTQPATARLATTESPAPITGAVPAPTSGTTPSTAASSAAQHVPAADGNSALDISIGSAGTDTSKTIADLVSASETEKGVTIPVATGNTAKASMNQTATVKQAVSSTGIDNQGNSATKVPVSRSILPESTNTQPGAEMKVQEPVLQTSGKNASLQARKTNTNTFPGVNTVAMDTPKIGTDPVVDQITPLESTADRQIDKVASQPMAVPVQTVAEKSISFKEDIQADDANSPAQPATQSKLVQETQSSNLSEPAHTEVKESDIGTKAQVKSSAVLATGLKSHMDESTQPQIVASLRVTDESNTEPSEAVQHKTSSSMFPKVEAGIDESANIRVKYATESHIAEDQEKTAPSSISFSKNISAQTEAMHVSPVANRNEDLQTMVETASSTKSSLPNISVHQEGVTAEAVQQSFARSNGMVAADFDQAAKLVTGITEQFETVFFSSNRDMKDTPPSQQTIQAGNTVVDGEEYPVSQSITADHQAPVSVSVERTIVDQRNDPEPVEFNKDFERSTPMGLSSEKVDTNPLSHEVGNPVQPESVVERQQPVPGEGSINNGETPLYIRQATTKTNDVWIPDEVKTAIHGSRIMVEDTVQTQVQTNKPITLGEKIDPVTAVSAPETKVPEIKTDFKPETIHAVNATTVRQPLSQSVVLNENISFESNTENVVVPSNETLTNSIIEPPMTSAHPEVQLSDVDQPIERAAGQSIKQTTEKINTEIFVSKEVISTGVMGQVSEPSEVLYASIAQPSSDDPSQPSRVTGSSFDIEIPQNERVAETALDSDQPSAVTTKTTHVAEDKPARPQAVQAESDSGEPAEYSVNAFTDSIEASLPKPKQTVNRTTEQSSADFPGVKQGVNSTPQTIELTKVNDEPKESPIAFESTKIKIESGRSTNEKGSSLVETETGQAKNVSDSALFNVSVPSANELKTEPSLDGKLFQNALQETTRIETSAAGKPIVVESNRVKSQQVATDIPVKAIGSTIDDVVSVAYSKELDVTEIEPSPSVNVSKPASSSNKADTQLAETSVSIERPASPQKRVQDSELTVPAMKTALVRDEITNAQPIASPQNVSEQLGDETEITDQRVVVDTGNANPQSGTQSREVNAKVITVEMDVPDGMKDLLEGITTQMVSPETHSDPVSPLDETRTTQSSDAFANLAKPNVVEPFIKPEVNSEVFQLADTKSVSMNKEAANLKPSVSAGVSVEPGVQTSSVDTDQSTQVLERSGSKPVESDDNSVDLKPVEHNEYPDSVRTPRVEKDELVVDQEQVSAKPIAEKDTSVEAKVVEKEDTTNSRFISGIEKDEPVVGQQPLVTKQVEHKDKSIDLKVVENSEKTNTGNALTVEEYESVIKKQPVSAKPTPQVETKEEIKARDIVSKDEEVRPAGKRTELNPMPGSTVSTTSPVNEAKIGELNGKMPAEQINIQGTEVVQQIIRQMNGKIRSGATSMHLQLNPKELGAIEVDLVSGPQGVHITFFAEQTSTGRLLETQLNQLRDSLVDSGVQLSGLNIGHQNTQGQKGGTFNQEPNAAPWPNEIFVEERRAGAVETSASERQFGQPSDIDYRI